MELEVGASVWVICPDHYRETVFLEAEKTGVLPGVLWAP